MLNKEFRVNEFQKGWKRKDDEIILTPQEFEVRNNQKIFFNI